VDEAILGMSREDFIELESGAFNLFLFEHQESVFGWLRSFGFSTEIDGGFVRPPPKK